MCQLGHRDLLRISIHALREEGDTAWIPPPPGRRPTRHHASVGVSLHISIHALREEGDRQRADQYVPGEISIHALREEGDSAVRGATWRIFYFYPRPPRGGRLQFCIVVQAADLISIHALREEGDLSVAFWVFMALVFLSTPSARRATTLTGGICHDHRFLSTPSARRATSGHPALDAGVRISIHALREEGDRGAASASAGTKNFYPRPPRGGRLMRRFSCNMA